MEIRRIALSEVQPGDTAILTAECGGYGSGTLFPVIGTDQTAGVVDCVVVNDGIQDLYVGFPDHCEVYPPEHIMEAQLEKIRNKLFALETNLGTLKLRKGEDCEDIHMAMQALIWSMGDLARSSPKD